MPHHQRRSAKKRREFGWVASWTPSKSGGYGVIRSGDMRVFFHCSALLDPQAEVKTGTQVTFTLLPGNGKRRRGSEVQILKRK